MFAEGADQGRLLADRVPASIGQWFTKGSISPVCKGTRLIEKSFLENFKEIASDFGISGTYKDVVH